MTLHVAKAREELYELWQSRTNKWTGAEHQSFASTEDYYGFCAAKDWIQDTSEVLICHRRNGFSAEPMSAYLEFWGVLQAAVVQQDAIRELHRVIKEENLPKQCINSAWTKLRNLRNLAVGHPTRHDHLKPLTRSVTSRHEKSYENIELIVYGTGVNDRQGNVKIERINLGELLDLYDFEAGRIIEQLHSALEKKLE